MLYIGLDIGTCGCKATVIDDQGNIKDQSHFEYSTETPIAGYVEIDAQVVWQAVCTVLAKVARRDITALAIASFGEAAILLDERDQVLSRSIFYSDIRGTEEVANIRETMDAAEMQAITGMPINPMYTANKLLWIKKHDSGLYNRTRHIMLFGDYVAFMLTGRRVIDYSLASRTMLFDINEKKWSSKVAAALDIDTNLFPETVPPGSPVDFLRPDIARKLGLSPAVLVILGGHDQIMTALGSGAVCRGEAADGMGSAECITLVLDKHDITSQMYENNFCCEPYVFDDRYVTLAFNSSSGTAIKWYRDAIEAERAAQYKRSSKNLYAVLDQECSPEISSIFFLPYVAGSGTPYMDAKTGGAFLGLRVSSRKQEMYRAVLEGICFEMKYNLVVLEQCGIKLQNIIAAGGGSESSVLMQIKADIWGRPISTLQTAQAGTVGLAILCGHVTGAYPSLEKAARQMVQYGQSFFPDPARSAQYASRFEIYKHIYPAIKSII
jgi:xylulokinase